MCQSITKLFIAQGSDVYLWIAYLSNAHWKKFSHSLPSLMRLKSLFSLLIYFLQFLFGPLYPLFIYTLLYLSFSDFYFVYFPSRNELLFLFFETIYFFPIPTWIFYRPNTINRYTGRKSYYLFLSCLPLNLRDLKESGKVGRTTYQDQRKHFLFAIKTTRI